MAKLLVTGASGKLGQLVLDALLARGVNAADIIATTRDPSKLSAYAAKGIEVRAADFNDVELTRKAGDSLGSITLAVSNIQSMNQQIAAAAEEQSAVAEEISRSILSVRDVSEQTATASDETAKSSAELARLGGQLQALVSRFRV